MDYDLAFVGGLILLGLAFPALLSAFSESRPPRTAAVLGVVGGALLALALTQRPGTYSFQTIPDVFVRVVAAFI